MLTPQDVDTLFFSKFAQTKFCEAITSKEFEEAKDYFRSRLFGCYSVSDAHCEEIARDFAEKKHIEKYGKPTPVFKMYSIETEFRKVKVSYVRMSGCIRIFQKDYGTELFKILPECQNDSDAMRDYHDKTSCCITESDEFYDEAKQAAEKLQQRYLKSNERKLEKAKQKRKQVAQVQ